MGLRPRAALRAARGAPLLVIYENCFCLFIRYSAGRSKGQNQGHFPQTTAPLLPKACDQKRKFEKVIMKKGTTLQDDVHRIHSMLKVNYIQVIFISFSVFLRLLALIIHELGIGHKGN